MSSLCSASAWYRAAALPALLFALAAAGLSARAQQFSADAGWRDVSVAEYRQHLIDLDALAAACQQQRASQSAAQKNGPARSNSAQSDLTACDAARVGPDDRVAGFAGGVSQPRQVRFDWLRFALGRAGNKAAFAQPNAIAPLPAGKNPPLTVDALLAQARQRLQQDLQQAQAPAQPSPAYAAERKSLDVILAERAYKDVTQVSARERFAEWLDNQLDQILMSLVRFGSRSPWIAFTLRGLLLAAICTALIWLLLQIERRARVRLVPDAAPAPPAPSARQWQLWLKDARTMAAQGLWREAIHFLYWASIARLESRIDARWPWPADRTRTPREYLGLLAAADPRKPSLTALTRSFERTWYGGRAAAASDFDAALELARSLGVAVE